MWHDVNRILIDCHDCQKLKTDLCSIVCIMHSWQLLVSVFKTPGP